ncbi:MAG: hypothetical protein ACOH12_12690 [Parvibaculaceae bacterium]
MLISSGFFRAQRTTLALALALSGALSGCASSNITGQTLGETLAQISAAIMSGGDRAVAALSGKECLTLSALIRNGASYCDTPVTLAEASGDSTDPYLLGFAPVDRRAAADFSLEIARKENAGIDAPLLAFGMISANNLPSYSYRVKTHDGQNTRADKVAMSETTTQTIRENR